MTLRTLRDYLRLIRLPNVFTALADILAGTAIAHAVNPEVPWSALCMLLPASAGLYLSALAFNDIADRQEDAQYRPERPIPSGAVSLCGALMVAFGLLMLGLVAAYLHSPFSLYLALAIACFFLLYDFSTKHVVVLGPLTLGICRTLNFSLGLSADPAFADAFLALDPARLAPALAIGIYAAGLTAFSVQEEKGRQWRAILLGWFFCGGALLLAGFYAPYYWGWIIFGPLASLLIKRTQALWHSGKPKEAKALVLTGVLGICAVDAGSILAHAGIQAWPWSLTVLALLLPARQLARWLAQREA